MAEQWMPLDGSWHQSVATRSSALHLAKDKALSSCRGLFLLEDMVYSREEAIAEGRACKQCLKRARADSSTLTKGAK